MALLAVLIVAFVVAGASASFAWLMDQQQTRAGWRYHSTAALAAAEAGVYWSLAVLEGTAPDGTPGRAWRPSAYIESWRAGPLQGRFTVSLVDDTDGAVLITSTGEVAGVARRVRARVYLATPALLAAIYARGIAYLERPPAALVVLPYGAGIGDRPWIHLAAGRGVHFASTDVAINGPASPFVTSAGPMDWPESANVPTMIRSPGPVRFLLPRGAGLTLGPQRLPVDIQDLRAFGVDVAGVVLPGETLPDLPGIDRSYYRGLAARNTANADVNEAAGKHAGDDALASKRDSLYSSVEFEQLTRYLRAEGLTGPLRGLIYVEDGGVSLLDGQQLSIVEGGLVTESTVEIADGASLEITHSAATRTTPGLVIVDTGGLIVTQGGRLRVHGVLYASRTIDLGVDAQVDVVGAVLGDDAEYSLRTYGASLVVRYDPAVLGTRGFRATTNMPVVAWVAAWEELP